MTYSTQIPIALPSAARGIHYTPGTDFLYFLRTDGVYRIPVNPAVMIAEVYGYTLPASKQANLNSYGNYDLRWISGVLRGLFGAKIAALLGITSLDQITLDQLLNVDWVNDTNNALSEPGTSTGGNFYAVRIPLPNGDFNYAKVRIYSSGGTKFDWITYIATPNANQMSAISGDLRDIVVSPYEEEIYVSG